MEEPIVITEWEYRHGDSKFPKHMVVKDETLSDTIMEYYHHELFQKDIELWVHDFNIIATSKKFYGAFYEKDLKHTDEKE